MIDLPGTAILAYFNGAKRKKLFVHDTFGPKVDMPISHYFRNESEMPNIEKLALSSCLGKTLDIGAAAGSHVLALQKNLNDVYALEISDSAIEVMKRRGVKNTILADFFAYNEQKFDTLLLLMNGIGLSGTIDNLPHFLAQCKNLLNPNGQIIFDSSDISYMYEDDDLPFPKTYYGQINCCYEYDQKKSNWFDWLYIDKNTMEKIAMENSWQFTLLAEEGEEGHYLAKLTR